MTHASVLWFWSAGPTSAAVTTLTVSRLHGMVAAVWFWIIRLGSSAPQLDCWGRQPFAPVAFLLVATSQASGFDVDSWFNLSNASVPINASGVRVASLAGWLVGWWCPRDVRRLPFNIAVDCLRAVAVATVQLVRCATQCDAWPPAAGRLTGSRPHRPTVLGRPSAGVDRGAKSKNTNVRWLQKASS
jgi:hypothetical protein